MTHVALSTLTDHDLLAETARVVAGERQSTAQLIALLAEVDARRLYLAAGHASLFTYCTQVLHLSECAAYERITAARLARRLPVVLERLAEGAVTLTAVGLLSSHLTPENAESLLDAARHRSKREVERLVACLVPQPDIAPRIRKLAARPVDAPARCLPAVPVRARVAAEAAVAAPAQAPAATRPTIAPLAPERYVIKVTVSGETHRKLRRAQDLLRHTIPSGDPAAIIDRSLTLLVDDLERTRLARINRRHLAALASADSAVGSRHVPAAVKREIWSRDGGRCAFVGTEGRCAETAFLELHHIVPFAAGGATSIANLALRCRAHNGHEARLFFGETDDSSRQATDPG